MAKVKYVLVVCTGNSCRSPMAEGLLRIQYQDHPNLVFFSAGTAALPGAKATNEAILAVREFGADISQHIARGINQTLMNQSALIIAMTSSHAIWLKQSFPEHRNKIAALGELAGGDLNVDISDPVACSLDIYRQTAGQIKQLLAEAYQTILERVT